MKRAYEGDILAYLLFSYDESALNPACPVDPFMQPVSEAQSMNDGPHYHFRTGVATSDVRHVEASLFRIMHPMAARAKRQPCRPAAWDD